MKSFAVIFPPRYLNEMVGQLPIMIESKTCSGEINQ